MPVVAFDHVAIPSSQPEQMLRFYRDLGFTAPDPDEWRSLNAQIFSVHFGDNKINFHAPTLWERGDFTLRGHSARPGCGDFCFVWSGTVAELTATLEAAGATIEEGPVRRLGGRRGGLDEGVSLYTRDPDANLLEFIVYPPKGEEERLVTASRTSTRPTSRPSRPRS